MELIFATLIGPNLTGTGPFGTGTHFRSRDLTALVFLLIVLRLLHEIH